MTPSEFLKSCGFDVKTPLSKQCPRCCRLGQVMLAGPSPRTLAQTKGVTPQARPPEPWEITALANGWTPPSGRFG